VEEISEFQKAWRPIEKVINRLRRFTGSSARSQIQPRFATGQSPALRAVEWIHAFENPEGGIYVSSNDLNSYPEVTGYLIPTLLEYHEEDLAARLTRWLMRIQRRDGSFPSANGVPHVFDTGQALRGLLAASELVPDATASGASAAEYLYNRAIADRARGFDVDSVWIRRYSKSIPMSTHLYVLPPLLKASEIFQKPKYRTVADNCLEYYVKFKDALQLGTLTHFLAYELEALIDLGRSEAATPILDRLRDEQGDDGSVRAADRVSWVCIPGLAQLAVCWYKVGWREAADRALKWLEAHQTLSGGFCGSYGENASYFPNVEISWAPKFYLDAVLLRDRLSQNLASP
jgi:malonyl-CoA O-methyltransferase